MEVLAMLWYNKGMAVEIPSLSPQREAEFWQRVNRTDECWEWIGSNNGGQKRKTGIGYGVFSVENRQFNAHRIAAFLTMESFDPSLCVLHTCDNPLCVRPSHLFQGTKFDNNRDAIQKGRAFFGSERQREFARERYAGAGNPHAHLTTAQVEDIRLRYQMGGVTQQALADEYGVSQTQIYRLVRGKQWKAGV